MPASPSIVVGGYEWQEIWGDESTTGICMLYFLN
jgi:hypothetical protein